MTETRKDFLEGANAVDIEKEVNRAEKFLNEGDRSLLVDMLITPEMLLGFSEQEMELQAKTYAGRKMGEQENTAEAKAMKSTRKKVEGKLSATKKDEMFNQALEILT